MVPLELPICWSLIADLPVSNCRFDDSGPAESEKGAKRGTSVWPVRTWPAVSGIPVGDDPLFL